MVRKIYKAVKTQKPDGFEKSSSYGAQISRSEVYCFTPQRLRDATHRRNWTFCGTVKGGGGALPPGKRRMVEMEGSWAQKRDCLRAVLGNWSSLLVAYSGGVDSTLLVKIAHGVLGDNLVAVTVVSALQPRREREAAVALAAVMGVRHLQVAGRALELPDFRANPRERCYVCKHQIFGDLQRLAARMGFAAVVHGANLDDLSDTRPGNRAAAELGVAAPLIAAGLNKADIRALAKVEGLPNWNAPALACLASRIPYGTPIRPETLAMIDRAEEVLCRLGYKDCRVRYHGSVARIELPAADVARFLEKGLRREVVRLIREIGFDHVSLDLAGYVAGSLNRGRLPPLAPGDPETLERP